jgi:hypothetical protein
MRMSLFRSLCSRMETSGRLRFNHIGLIINCYRKTWIDMLLVLDVSYVYIVMENILP